MRNIKKYLTIVISLILINMFTLNASEYIISNCTEYNKDKIYEIVSKYRFPSILSKFTQKEFQKKYPNLNLIETFKTKENEYKFLQHEITNIDKNAEIYSVPKSLYQFMVYDYFAETKEQRNEKMFELNEYAIKEKWALTKACSYFMNDKKVKSLFWKINKHALDLYKKNKGDIKKIINDILNAYACITPEKGKHVFRRELDKITSMIHKSKFSRRIETLIGLDPETNKIPKSWSEKKRQELKEYVTSCIMSETKNPSYVVYRGGKSALDIERSYRSSVCFSDGLFSGVFDPGACAFVLSTPPSKLWKLELDRTQLLEKQYPIFIPPAHHLLSSCGSAELFHIRTQVVRAVVHEGTNEFESLSCLSIQWDIEPLVAGYKLSETPEYFTTQNPEIWKYRYNLQLFKDEFERTNQGTFDVDGASKLESMLQNVKEVSEGSKINLTEPQFKELQSKLAYIDYAITANNSIALEKDRTKWYTKLKYRKSVINEIGHAIEKCLLGENMYVHDVVVFYENMDPKGFTQANYNAWLLYNYVDHVIRINKDVTLYKVADTIKGSYTVDKAKMNKAIHDIGEYLGIKTLKDAIKFYHGHDDSKYSADQINSKFTLCNLQSDISDTSGYIYKYNPYNIKIYENENVEEEACYITMDQSLTDIYLTPFINKKMVNNFIEKIRSEKSYITKINEYIELRKICCADLLAKHPYITDAIHWMELQNRITKFDVIFVGKTYTFDGTKPNFDATFTKHNKNYNDYTKEYFYDIK